MWLLLNVHRFRRIDALVRRPQSHAQNELPPQLARRVADRRGCHRKTRRREDLRIVRRLSSARASTSNESWDLGLLESAYEQCVAHELSRRGLPIRVPQRPVPLEYRGIRLECGYRLDRVVEDPVVVEIKSVDRVLPIHKAQ